MGVNFEGGVSPISPGDGSHSPQQPSVGKTLHHKVTSYPGREIVGVKLQLLEQGMKAISERKAVVVEAYDGWLLGRGAGGTKESAAAFAELKKDAGKVQQKEQELEKAVVEYREAASKFEAKLEKHAPDKEIKQLQKALDKAEAKIGKSAAQLNEKLDKLERHAGESVSSQSGSILDGFYDPPSDGWFGKQDKEILLVRQESLDIMVRDLDEQLTALQGEATHEGEVQRLKQQLLELSASSQKLQAHIGKGKKFHQEVTAQKGTSSHVEQLKRDHAEFRGAVKRLGEARKLLDTAVRSGVGDTQSKELRQQAEANYKQAEKAVGSAKKKLAKAEAGLKNALESDRKVSAENDKKLRKEAAEQARQLKEEKLKDAKKSKKSTPAEPVKQKSPEPTQHQKESKQPSRAQSKKQTVQAPQPEFTSSSKRAKSRWQSYGSA